MHAPQATFAPYPPRDVRTRGMVTNMKQHMQPITELSILADDAHLVASCDDRKWSLW